MEEKDLAATREEGLDPKRICAMSEGLTAREAAKTDSTQVRDMRMEATLRINHLMDNRDDLSLMLKALREMADAEPDAALNMALELAALEIGRLADRYNDEMNRVMWTASLALEGK